MEPVKHLLSIDLEDWFHLLDNDETATPDQWQNFESRVENNTHRLLNLFKKHKTHATFFVLGWIAEKHPYLIKEIQAQGHEIGCHSYAHPLIYNMTEGEFEKDLVKALTILQNTTGTEIKSYRAPGFSITKDCLWAFDLLTKHGITHDSSVFPTSRAHGGLAGYPEKPYTMKTKYGNLKEFPISLSKILHKKVVFAGGGYFRLFPSWYLQSQFKKFTQNNTPVITYLHPRDIDVNQPRLELSKVREFKTYVGLSSTLKKLNTLLRNYSFTNIKKINLDD
jgi:polysaccharide deacetylase family protein (PEP-CTERM system associated)